MLLPLDDCFYALQATTPHFTWSSLHRCLQRHGISRLSEANGDKPGKRKLAPAQAGDATVKRFHYEEHGHLRRHLADFVDAYDLHDDSKRLKV